MAPPKAVTEGFFFAKASASRHKKPPPPFGRSPLFKGARGKRFLT